MDDLVEDINRLHITRDEAAREYQHTLDESSRRERILLDDIRRCQRQSTQDNTTNNQSNPIRVGDIIQITNKYQMEESGMVGRVV